MAYGFEFYTENGRLFLDSRRSAVRLLKTIDVDRNFSGSISVPEFSTNDGYYFFKPVQIAWVPAGGPIIPYSNNPLPANNYTYNPYYSSGNFVRPTLSWDEATRTMTITPSAASWPFEERKVDFQIKFLRYI